MFSDTMDLLGGFEQADVGNSLLELFSQIQSATTCLINQTVQTDVSEALR